MIGLFVKYLSPVNIINSQGKPTLFSSLLMSYVTTWLQKNHKLFSATYILCSKRNYKRFPIKKNNIAKETYSLCSH
jgi:hypothetical protein